MQKKTCSLPPFLWFLLLASSSCAVTGEKSRGAEHALPVVDPAAVRLDARAWTVREVDGRKCAVLRGKQKGKIPIPAWWGNTLRPPRGASFLCTFRYKDTVSSPVIVKVFAGLPGFYEMHRIGGKGDNRWKTARIPLPWDMVMRIPGTGNTEIYLINRAQEEFPVGKLSVHPGDPARDEARWARETREWTARVQKEKRKRAKLPKPESPSIPPALRNAPAVVFVRPYHDLIHPTSAPRKGEAGKPISITLARNEIEPAQFGVYANGKDLKQVTLSLAEEGLVDARGRKLACTVRLRTAEYSVVRSGHLFPQRLWPAYPVDIPRGRSHLFWVTVETKFPGSVPGTYRGTIRVKAADVETVEVPLVVRVLPIKLLTMTEAGLHMGGCVTGLLPAHELEYMVRNNHNAINLWFYGFAPRIIRKSPQDFDLDFTIQDDFMEHARRAGIRLFVFFLGGNPYGFPDTQHLERELYRRVIKDGSNLMGDRIEMMKKMCKSPYKILPEIRPLYKKWVKKFMAHAKKHHWPEPVLTPFDEPAKWVQGGWARAKVYYYRDERGRDHVEKIKRKRWKSYEKKLARLREKGIDPIFIGYGGADTWIKSYFKDACAAIHEAWPEARVYGSIHHARPGLVFLEDVEIFCTNAIHEDPKLGDKVRAGGPKKVFWQYSGCNDARGPAEARYTFGFFFAAFDSRGSLAWAYNWGNRFDTSSGDNWLYAWTTPYSVVPAPYYEGMREAWDDRRYIETLKRTAREKGASAEADKLLESIFNRASTLRTGGGRDTVKDFWARSKDPDALNAMRREIAALLLRLAAR